MMNIAELTRVGVVKRFPTDEIFFHQGDPGSEMYIILKGLVGVYLNSVDGYQFPVARLGMGDFFGEMSLLEFMPRSATIQALEETVVVILNQHNFAEVISKEPELAYRIMKGMCSRVRQLNEEVMALIHCNTTVSSQEDNVENLPANIGTITREKDSELAITATCADLSLPTLAAVIYPYEAPPQDEAYLFNKEVDCPVCEKSFPVSMTRSSHLRLERIDADLRQHFVEFEPLWYMVWVCPNCYYANFNYEFKQVSVENNKYIMKESNNMKRDYLCSFSRPRQLREVLASYYLVMQQTINVKRPDSAKLGKLWLRLSWLYQDAQDQDRYLMASQKALEYFKDSHYNSTRDTSPEQAQRLHLLLGELSLRVGNDKEALNYFHKSLIRRGGNKNINRQAEKRIEEVKSQLGIQGIALI